MQAKFLFGGRHAQKHARIAIDVHVARGSLVAFARQMQRPIFFPATLVEKLLGDHFAALFEEQAFAAEHITLGNKAHYRIFIEQERDLLLRLRVRQLFHCVVHMRSCFYRLSPRSQTRSRHVSPQ